MTDEDAAASMREVEERILQLHDLIEDEDIVANAASRASMMRFLTGLGRFSRPAIFIMQDGTYRAVWGTRTGVRPFEQFAVLFTGGSRTSVVYSDPTAKKCRTKRRICSGGLVAIETSFDALEDLLMRSGHDGTVREGEFPKR